MRLKRNLVQPLKAKYAYVVNSAQALIFWHLWHLRHLWVIGRIMRGDEVITVAAGFPTTINR